MPNDDMILDSPMNRPAALDDFAAREFRPRLRIRPIAGRRPEGLFDNTRKAERHIITDDEVSDA